MKVASTVLITALALSAVQAAPTPKMEQRSESNEQRAAESDIEARFFGMPNPAANKPAGNRKVPAVEQRDAESDDIEARFFNIPRPSHHAASGRKAAAVEQRSENEERAAESDELEARFKVLGVPGKIVKGVAKLAGATSATYGAVSNMRDGNGHPPGMRSLPEDAEGELDARASHKHQIKVATGIVGTLGAGLVTATNTYSMLHPRGTLQDEDAQSAIQARGDAQGEEQLETRLTHGKKLVAKVAGGVGASVAITAATMAAGLAPSYFKKKTRGLEEDDLDARGLEYISPNETRDLPQELFERDQADIQELVARKGWKSASTAEKIAVGTGALTITGAGLGLAAAGVKYYKNATGKKRDVQLPAYEDELLARKFNWKGASHADKLGVVNNVIGGTAAAISAAAGTTYMVKQAHKSRSVDEDEDSFAQRSVDEDSLAPTARKFNWKSASHADKLGVVNGAIGTAAAAVGTAAGTTYMIKSGNKRSVDAAPESDALLARKFGWKGASHADKLGVVNGAIGTVAAAVGIGAGATLLVKNHNKNKRDLDDDAAFETRAFRAHKPGAATTGAALGFVATNIAGGAAGITLMNAINSHKSKARSLPEHIEELETRSLPEHIEELEARRRFGKAHMPSAATAGAAIGTVAATIGLAGSGIALHNVIKGRDLEEYEARRDAEDLLDARGLPSAKEVAGTISNVYKKIALGRSKPALALAAANRSRRDAEEEALEARRFVEDVLEARRYADELQARKFRPHMPSAATAGGALGTMAATIGLGGSGIALHNAIKSRDAAHVEELEARRGKAHMPSADTVGAMMGTVIGGASIATGAMALHNAIHSKPKRRSDVYDERDLADAQAFASALQARREAQDTYVF